MNKCYHYCIIALLVIMNLSVGAQSNCNLLTYSQGGWGAPNGTAANFRDLHFDEAFPNGLVVGCDNNKYVFTSAQAIENFLPAGGVSSVINGVTTNPTNVQNQLASQLVAATLAVTFDGYFSDFAPASTSLGDAVFASGQFQGMTVQAFLDQANLALGGCLDMNLTAVAANLDMLNLNFDAGVNKLYFNILIKNKGVLTWVI